MDVNEIYLVLVLYKTSLEDSKTINSLENILEERVNLLVFDNSPERQYESEKFNYKKFNIEYYHDLTNPGLSTAYNHALDIAYKSRYSWLLLLDQDTTFTKMFFDDIKELRVEKLPSSVVAIIPRVVSQSESKSISPVKIYPGGVCRPLNPLVGEISAPISGINSGTMLRVSYMNSINGFSKEYSLDMLDHWYFRRIFQDRKSIYILESNILQDLSVFGNFEENVSFVRYQQMLKSELLFIKEEGFISQMIFKFRLISRIIKQLKYKNKEYYKFTISQL
ncbi:glycosyltransferase [Flavobacterium sp. LHD-85]|uniref:glycosyltransferase n=1 Tax=Flavobacterium sp. LHD-85 TaxID=3071410 RepID=UPI0027E0523B|nr:glycosyltransferase [Flavobacterium sp. LHD-85]MDQ6529599.1 glycosyltransferase [Flavobacterium sp. LHD-85]